jgi:hypothetical protein
MLDRTFDPARGRQICGGFVFNYGARQFSFFPAFPGFHLFRGRCGRKPAPKQKSRINQTRAGLIVLAGGFGETVSVTGLERLA